MFTPILERPHPVGMGGDQRLYRFPNGYGASVIRFAHSYGGSAGLWELAVIRFEDASNKKFELVYDTPITDDVVGYLSHAEVEDLLSAIAELPEPKGS